MSVDTSIMLAFNLHWLLDKILNNRPFESGTLTIHSNNELRCAASSKSGSDEGGFAASFEMGARDRASIGAICAAAANAGESCEWMELEEVELRGEDGGGGRDAGGGWRVDIVGEDVRDDDGGRTDGVAMVGAFVVIGVQRLVVSCAPGEARRAEEVESCVTRVVIERRGVWQCVWLSAFAKSSFI